MFLKFKITSSMSLITASSLPSRKISIKNTKAKFIKVFHLVLSSPENSESDTIDKS